MLEAPDRPAGMPFAGPVGGLTQRLAHSPGLCSRASPRVPVGLGSVSGAHTAAVAPSEPVGGPSRSAGDRTDVLLPDGNLPPPAAVRDPWPPSSRAQPRCPSHTREHTPSEHTDWLAVALSAPTPCCALAVSCVGLCPSLSGVHGAAALIICFCSCRRRGAPPSPGRPPPAPSPGWAD